MENLNNVEAVTEETPIVSTELSEADNFEESVDLSKFGGDFEKLGKSYAHTEKAMRKAQEEAASARRDAEASKLREQQYAMAVMEMQKHSQQQQTPSEFDAYYQEWEENPAKAAFKAAKLAEARAAHMMQSQATSNAYWTAKQTIPDFAEMEPAMAQLALQAKQQGLVSQERLNSPDMINILYYTAKGIQSVHSQQQQATESLKNQRKQAAFTEGGSPTVSSSPKTFNSLDDELKYLKNKIGVANRPDYLGE